MNKKKIIQVAKRTLEIEAKAAVQMEAVSSARTSSGLNSVGTFTFSPSLGSVNGGLSR